MLVKPSVHGIMPGHVTAITAIILRGAVSNILGAEQNGRQLADIFKCNFLQENIELLVQISLTFGPKCFNDNMSQVRILNGLTPHKHNAIN